MISMDEKVKLLVKEAEQTKTGLLTIPSLQVEIKTKLGFDITRAHLTSLLKEDLNMRWRRIRP